MHRSVLFKRCLVNVGGLSFGMVLSSFWEHSDFLNSEGWYGFLLCLGLGGSIFSESCFLASWSYCVPSIVVLSISGSIWKWF